MSLIGPCAGYICCFFERYDDHRDLHVLTQSFPTRRSSDLSIVVDLKSEEGLALVKDLAAKCDVLVENYRPGVMDRLGLGYETLKAINPRLIYRSEEHTSELQSLMRTSYAVFCLKQKKTRTHHYSTSSPSHNNYPLYT